MQNLLVSPFVPYLKVYKNDMQLIENQQMRRTSFVKRKIGSGGPNPKARGPKGVEEWRCQIEVLKRTWALWVWFWGLARVARFPRALVFSESESVSVSGKKQTQTKWTIKQLCSFELLSQFDDVLFGVCLRDARAGSQYQAQLSSKLSLCY